MDKKRCAGKTEIVEMTDEAGAVFRPDLPSLGGEGAKLRHILLQAGGIRGVVGVRKIQIVKRGIGAAAGDPLKEKEADGKIDQKISQQDQESDDHITSSPRSPSSVCRTKKQRSEASSFPATERKTSGRG